MDVAGSLVRRGLEAHATHGDQVKQHLPKWAALMLSVTAIIYVVAMFTIEYTFGRLIPTLLMVESPSDSIAFEPLPTEDLDSTINKDPEPVSRPTFITSSFRRTLRHLGGFRARFRGLGVFIVYGLLVHWIASILSVLPILNLIPRGLLTVGSAVLCAQLSLTWTHIVISQPSQRTWFRRIAPTKMWKKVAGPTAIYALAQQAAVYIPIYMAAFAGLGDQIPQQVARSTPKQKMMTSFMCFGIAIFSLLLTVLVVIPANVALTRVQASLLDDAEETIVPFDRSFGGKVIPEIVGGSGVIGTLDAWKTFDRASRIRLIKAYLKVFGMQMAVTVLFTLIFVIQLFIAVGSDWSKLMPKDGNKA